MWIRVTDCGGYKTSAAAVAAANNDDDGDDDDRQLKMQHLGTNGAEKERPFSKEMKEAPVVHLINRDIIVTIIFITITIQETST